MMIGVHARKSMSIFLRAFVDATVRFLAVGAYALALYGVPRLRVGQLRQNLVDAEADRLLARRNSLKVARNSPTLCCPGRNVHG